MNTAASMLQPAIEGAGATRAAMINEEIAAIEAKGRDESWDVTAKPEMGKVIELPTFRPLEFRPSEFFAAVQEWEGVVTSVGEDGFEADLWDMSSPSDEPSERAEIAYADIDPQDIGRVKVGAIFRWLIGHSRTRSGETSRKWVVYFRARNVQSRRPSAFEAVSLPVALKDAVKRSLSEPLSRP